LRANDTGRPGCAVADRPATMAAASLLLSKKEMPALTSAAPDARALTQTLARYRAPNLVRFELIYSVTPS